MPNFRMTLSYDGGRYNGWQRQGNTRNTIQEKVEAALSDVLGQPVEAAGSGRTDAGVHARAQTVSFRAETDLPTGEMAVILEGRDRALAGPAAPAQGLILWETEY